MTKLNKNAYNKVLHNNPKNKPFESIVIYNHEAYISDGFRAVKASLDTLTVDDDFATFESLDDKGKKRIKNLADIIHNRLTEYADDIRGCEFTTVEINRANFKKVFNAKKGDKRYSKSSAPVIFKINGVCINAKYLLEVMEIVKEQKCKTTKIHVGFSLKPVVVGNNENGLIGIVCPMYNNEISPSFTIDDVNNYKPPKPKAEAKNKTEAEEVIEPTPFTKLVEVKSKAETRRVIVFNRR